MKSVLQVVIIVTIVATALWWAVRAFVIESDVTVKSLDVRSLSYLRDDGRSQATPRDPSNAVVVGAAMPATPAMNSQDAQGIVRGAGQDDTARDAALKATQNVAVAKVNQVAQLPRPQKPASHAIDVTLEISPYCDAAVVAITPVSVQYRHESPTIKAGSLQELESLITVYRKCQQSIFQLSESPLNQAETTNSSLTQRRFDELKYFFIQHRVSKAALRYSKVP